MSQSDSHLTAQNDHLRVEVELLPQCQTKFDLYIDSFAVIAAYQKALKNVSKEVSIPGFRKGKANPQLIVDRYANVIKQECQDIVMRTALNEAIELTKIYPLEKEGSISRPVVHKCSIEEGSHITIEFERSFQVPSVDFSSLHVTAVPSQVITEAEQANSLYQLQLRFATYEPMENRAIEQGDFVDLDVELLRDPPEKIVDNDRFQVNEPYMPKEIMSTVIGMRKGESAEGEMLVKRATEDNEIKEEKIPFRVTIYDIWQGNLPAIDDALAQKVGLQTVDELQVKVREQMEQQAKYDAEAQTIQRINHALISNYSFDVPRSYILASTKQNLDRYFNSLTEAHRQQAKAHRREIRENIEHETIRQLQLFFLLQKIAADHKIQVTQEELSAELNRQLSLLATNQSKLDLSNRENWQEQLYNMAMEHKIQQFLLSKAVHLLPN